MLPLYTSMLISVRILYLFGLLLIRGHVHANAQKKFPPFILLFIFLFYGATLITVTNTPNAFTIGEPTQTVNNSAEFSLVYIFCNIQTMQLDICLNFIQFKCRNSLSLSEK